MAQALLKNGDNVIVETPTCNGALGLFEALHVNPVGWNGLMALCMKGGIFMNVSKRLAELADLKSNETAIICGEQHFTYKALNTGAAALAEYLMGQGLGKRDNLAVILPNCVEFALVYFAAAKIGATFTPIDNRLGARQIDAILKDTGARVCFVFSGFTQQHSLSHPVRVIDVEGETFIAIMQKPPACDDITADIDPADTALYLHTSGTTGRPKIVELSYANLHCFPEAMKECTIQGEEEVLGIILPMSFRPRQGCSLKKTYGALSEETRRHKNA